MMGYLCWPSSWPFFSTGSGSACLSA
uniref:Uncharacterized protein n=1 Tax=Anguilla anguilla TaxID=7936 RepID=A0A0E9ST04_ANGAN